MKKIISLFKRDYTDQRNPILKNEVTEGAEWVINGCGVATIKYDGTACMIRGGKLFKRYDCKKGKQAPVGWEACEALPDPITGHWPGWLPVGNEPESKHFIDGFVTTFPDFETKIPSDGTYELIGEKVQGNPYKTDGHLLVEHGNHGILPPPPRSFDELRRWFVNNKIEGIVWHDGPRMVKIKRKDFYPHLKKWTNDI